MARRLDKLLQPGERVIHRLPDPKPATAEERFQGRLIIAALLFLAVEGLLVAGAITLVLIKQEAFGGGLFLLALAFLPSELLWLPFTLPPSVRQALVTDRRVIWIGGRFRMRLVEVALGELDRVAELHGKITLFRRNGKQAELAPALPTDAPTFASAAADTAGVAFETD